MQGDWYWDYDNWRGTFLEAAIDLGPPDDSRLRAAFEAAWSSPLLTGPLDPPRRDRPAGIPDKFEPDAIVFTSGIIDLPAASRPLGCEVIAVRDAVSDWLDIAVPEAMLQLAFHFKYLFEGGSWMDDVERGLALIADSVYAVVPFDLAIVGEETSGTFYANPPSAGFAITKQVVDDQGGHLLSPRLHDRLQPERRGEKLPSGLIWIPRPEAAT